MLWIKRNLLFVVGAAVAVLLVVAAVVNLLGKLSQDGVVTSELEQQWESLKSFYQENPFPSQNNLNLMRGDNQKLQKFVADSRPLFTPVPAIRYTGVQSFKTALDTTVAQLYTSAGKSSVHLPPQFYFGFQGQANQLNFTPGGMRVMAHQMAEIQKFCEILFEAKINRLESIQRARAGTDDMNAAIPTAEFVDETIRTNSLGTIYPYRITMRCFSSELATVLEGFAKSPHGFIVKLVEVETVPLEPYPGFDPSQPPPPGMMPPPGSMPPRTFPPRTFIPPGGNPGTIQPGTPRQPGQPLPQGGGGRGGGRGGGSGGGGTRGGGGARGGGSGGGRTAVEPAPSQDLLPLHAPTAVLAAGGFGFPPGFGPKTNRTGLVTLLNEKPVRVTLYLESIVLR